MRKLMMPAGVRGRLEARGRRAALAMVTSVVLLAAGGAAPAGAQLANVTVTLFGEPVISTTIPPPTCVIKCLQLATTTPGSAGPKSRMHTGIEANVWHMLDADGDLPPLKGLAVIDQPYDISVLVEGTSAETFKVFFRRPAAATRKLPLRIELTERDSAGVWKTFGYDTLSTSAPAEFMGHIDLSDRDGDVGTDQKRVRIEPVNADRRVTMLSEQFTGHPVAGRDNRKITRVEVARSDEGDRVPSWLTADLTSSPAGDPTKHRLILDRDVRTVLGFELSEPGAGESTMGTVEGLPDDVDLTFTNRDLNGDGVDDAKVEYSAESSARRAELTGVSRKVVNGIARPMTVRAEVRDLPTRITELTKNSKPGGFEIVYASNGNATDAQVALDDSTAVTKARVVKLPKTFTLGYGSSEAGGNVDYSADAGSDRAEISHKQASGAHVEATLAGRAPDAPGDSAGALPNSVHIGFTKGEGKLAVSYTAGGTLPYVEVRGRKMSGLPAGDDHTARNLDLVLRDVPARLDFSSENHEVIAPPVYMANCDPDKPGCDLDADCDYSLPDPPDPCDAPQKVTRKTTKKLDLNIDAPQGAIGSIDFRINSILNNGEAADVRLPATSPTTGLPQDGLLVENLAEHYGAHAHVTKLRHAEARMTSVESTTREVRPRPNWPLAGWKIEHQQIDYRTEAQPRTLRIEKRDRMSEGRVFLNEIHVAKTPAKLVIDNVANTLSDLKTVDLESSDVITSVPRIGGGTVPGFEASTNVLQANGDRHLVKDLELRPLPRKYHICQHKHSDLCAQEVFDGSIERLRDGDADRIGCFPPTAPCPKQSFPLEPGMGNKGSVRMTADPSTVMEYREGNGNHVLFTPLTRFVLQGHKQKYACQRDLFVCEYALLGIDTGGHNLSGSLRSHDVIAGKYTQFSLPPNTETEPAFAADGYVWTGWKYSVVPPLGAVGDAGAQIRCPELTELIVADEDITDRFCHGHVFDDSPLPGKD